MILFNYVPELNDFLFWLQQLLAESLGKKKKGFIPVVSNAPKDHHSLIQLYLDGPKDKFYTFWGSSNKNNNKVSAINIPNNVAISIKTTPHIKNPAGFNA